MGAGLLRGGFCGRGRDFLLGGGVFFDFFLRDSVFLGSFFFRYVGGWGRGFLVGGGWRFLWGSWGLLWGPRGRAHFSSWEVCIFFFIWVVEGQGGGWVGGVVFSGCLVLVFVGGFLFFCRCVFGGGVRGGVLGEGGKFLGGFLSGWGGRVVGCWGFFWI